MLVQGGMSEGEQQKWLIEVVKITQNSKIILAKTQGEVEKGVYSSQGYAKTIKCRNGWLYPICD